MTVLTATELSKIRFTTGALDTAIWTDAIIQAEYDNAVLYATDTALIFPYTYVYVLRMLWGWQRAQQDRNTPHGDRQPRSQISERTKELLDYWESKSGLYGSAVKVGVFGLNLDWTEVDTDAETGL